jgi:hypothetical protein
MGRYADNRRGISCLPGMESRYMATFLVLPPRELLEHALIDFLSRVLPGIPTTHNLLSRLLEEITTGIGETYVVHREDLPESSDLAHTLREVFGAEPGDYVVEIGPPRTAGAATVQQWIVPHAGLIGTNGSVSVISPESMR